MKTTKLIIIFCLSAFSFGSMAQNLLIFESSKIEKTTSIAKSNNLKIHFHNSQIAVATGETFKGATVIDKTAWGTNENYFVIDVSNAQDKYISSLESIAKILYTGNDFYIVSVEDKNIKALHPDSHGGLTHISNTEVKFAKNTREKFKDVTYIQEIADLIDLIEIDTAVAYDLHMQDYGTRDAYHPNSVLAQEWIKSMFESYDLPAFTHDFTMPGGEASDNVYAVQEGSVYPDKFVVIGGHYDSYSFNENAPGADDNASGVAAIMEIARVLSDYDFNLSIIYCAFSGEEYGLYGSQALANEWGNDNKDIVGYLNLDMIGYLHPGNDYFTGMCVYEESYPLADYFAELVEMYVTDFYLDPIYYPIPNSDHTSFRNNGYMAIWPWEDVNNISPYIHTPNDTFDLSLNSVEYMQKFIESSLAFMADLAGPFNGYYPPMNLILEEFESSVELTWAEPTDITNFLQYKIYKNGEHIYTITDVNETSYTDSDIAIATEYNYHVIAEYGGSAPGESMPSNSVHVLFGHKSYFAHDFEDGVQNWTIANNEEGWQWGETVNGGNGTNYIVANSFAGGFSTTVEDYAISPEMDFSSKFNLEIYLDILYNKRNNEDFNILIKPAPQLPWILLEEIQPTNNFQSSVIELPISMQTENCQVAFYYNDKGQFCYYAAIDNIDFKGFDNDENYEAPTNLNLTESNGNIDLSWDVPTSNGVEKYYIYRNNVLYDSVDNASANTYMDTDINPENYYYYFVTAQYELRQSGPSNFATYGEPEEIIETKAASSKLEIFPNPAQQFINIKSEVAIDGVVSIYDLTGRKVKSEKANGFEILIHTGNLEQGTYFVVIEGKNKHTSKKITIMR